MCGVLHDRPEGDQDWAEIGAMMILWLILGQLTAFTDYWIVVMVATAIVFALVAPAGKPAIGKRPFQWFL